VCWPRAAAATTASPLRLRLLLRARVLLLRIPVCASLLFLLFIPAACPCCHRRPGCRHPLPHPLPPPAVLCLGLSHRSDNR